VIFDPGRHRRCRRHGALSFFASRFRQRLVRAAEIVVDEPEGERGPSGGRARAAKMTAKERSESARVAAAERWANKLDLPQATHEGELRIGDMVIPCAVLPGGRRLITLSGFMIALGRARQAKGRQYYSGDVNLPVFLTAKNLKEFFPKDLEVTSKGEEFKTKGGVRAYGYEATLLPKVCGVFLDAKAADALKSNQEHIAEKAMILVRALASTGIIALVDEATGYQYDRPRRDLEEHLKRFLAEELVRYVRSFPNDYFKHLCRLRGVELRPDMRLPQYFGHLTNDLVYRRIAPGLLKALKERRADRGRPSNKLHWWTSEELGHPALQLHLGTVITLMKINTEYDAFYAKLNELAPIYPDTPGLFDNPDDWQSPMPPVKKK
jgi:hypothetical protein